MTTDEFISKAREAHGDKYDYSEVVYVNYETPVKIVCPVHGVFFQQVGNHLSGKGCKECAIESRAKKRLFWTKERVFEEARKYKTLGDFQKGSGSAYEKARASGWLVEMSWLERKMVPRGQWQDKERVIEESRKYKTRKEFQVGSTQAYSVAWKNGWLEEMTWLVRPKAHNFKWTKEKVFEESKKYSSRSQFERGSHGAYEQAKMNGWLDEMTWLTTPVHENVTLEDLVYCIYGYFDEPNKVVYIGLTRNLQQRKYQHRTGIGRGSAVHEYFGEEVPEPVILKSGLNYEEAQLWENKFVEKYREDGWILLNRAATGLNCSSLGAAILKWNEQTLEEEARKYRTKNDFRNGNGAAYAMALKKGLLADYDWFENGRKLPKEEVIRISRKYKTLKEFRKKATSTYVLALRNGWVKDLVWLEREIHTNWTYEACRAEALKHKTKKEFLKASAGAYSAANKNGWMKDFDWLENGSTPNGFWTRERVFEESRKYSSKSEFKAKASGAFKVAWKNGWLEEMDWLKKKRE